MKHLFKCSLFAGILLIAACGSGTSSGGSSSTRTVGGTVDSSSSSAALSSSTKAAGSVASDNCLADTIIATSVDGTAASTDIDDDCSFSIDLAVDTSYVISFTLNNEFVATLIFETGLAGQSSSDIPLTDGDPIDLGLITFTGNVALAENNVLDECDDDGDGESNYDDYDDDGDGIEDESESDCDFDGFLDDHDDHSSCESSGSLIYRVKPYDGADDVDLDKDIKVYTGCEIDETTVTSDTFVVESDEGDVMDCQFDLKEDGTMIECGHDDNPFMANATYIVTIDGVACLDGTALPSTEWEFSTSSDDSSDGICYEDDFDDENESEDDSGDDDNSGEDDQEDD